MLSASCILIARLVLSEYRLRASHFAGEGREYNDLEAAGAVRKKYKVNQ